MAVVATVIIITCVVPTRQTVTVPYSDFITMLKNPGKTHEVVDGKKTYVYSKLHENAQEEPLVIGKHEILGNIHRKQLRPKIDAAKVEKKAFRTPKLGLEKEPQIAELLQQIRHTGEDQPTGLRLYWPILLLAAMSGLLFIYMMRRITGTGSPMAFGRSRGRMYAHEEVEVSFDDAAGIEEAVEELKEVVEFLRNSEKYQVLGGRIPKGVLLVGPPGTGITLLAKAIAGEAGVPFFSLSGSDFVEMFVGVGAARVRDLFGQAEAKSPCIIFIDELDALGKTRGGSVVGGHDEREQTLNALLVEMDGFASNSGIIVMAATNRPETLDPALLRPGRFDRHVLVDRPDVRGREAILNVHIQKIKLNESVDVRSIAGITSGFVGADIANLVNEAALLAARNGKESV
ncbi:MAG: AAA family ATPase, partial [Planctomycetales bacterium]